MKIFKTLSFKIITATALLLVVFSALVSAIGYFLFTNSIKNEYMTSTLNMSRTAAALVHGESINKYLTDGADAEYEQTKQYLDIYCDKIEVSLVYVLSVDVDTFTVTSVFDSIDNTVDNTNYTHEGRALGDVLDESNTLQYKEPYLRLYNKETEYEIVYRTTNLKKGRNPHITSIVPIMDENDDVVALLSIQRPMKELQKSQRPYIVNISIVASTLLVISMVVIVLYMGSQVVKPLKNVMKEAHRFSIENVKNENFKTKSRILEINDLGESIDKMETDMMNNINNLTNITSEKERISTELNIASVIQESSVPNVFPAFPDRLDFDIYASMTPAKEVGGDFYNFFFVDDNHLALVMADVSGKGVPAALFMMVTNILLSERLLSNSKPSDALATLNKRICPHNVANMFVTMWVGILDLQTGKLTYANAGHDDPVVYSSKKDKFELIQSPHGLVVGAMDDVTYENHTIKLNKGDKLFLYTDGIPEAIDKHNHMYTLDRMVKTLNEFKSYNPKELIEAIKDDVDKYASDTPQFDDMTMLCIELKDISNIRSLTIDAKLENLDKVIDFVNTELEKNEANMKTLTQVDLSVEEIYVNICHYAYPENNGIVSINLNIDTNELIIKFIDSGIKFNPLEKVDPDTTLSSEDRNIGGLGIFLVKNNMDEVTYDYIGNKNILTITKKLG